MPQKIEGLTPQKIQRTMCKCAGDIERAAKWLGCSGRTLRRHIHSLGMSSLLGKIAVPRDRDAWTLEEERNMVHLMRAEIERVGLPPNTTKIGGPAITVALALGRTAQAVRGRWLMLRGYELRAARQTKRLVLGEKELLEIALASLSRSGVTVASTKWVGKPRLEIELK